MELRMRRMDQEMNMDRFYSVKLTRSLMGDPGVERCWGRTGTWGQIRLDWYENTQRAQQAISDIVRKKLHKGYILDAGS